MSADVVVPAGREDAWGNAWEDGPGDARRPPYEAAVVQGGPLPTVRRAAEVLQGIRPSGLSVAEAVLGADG